MFDDRPDSAETAQLFDIADKAAHALHRHAPENSALGVLSSFQKLALLCFTLGAAAAAILFPLQAFITFNALFTAYFIIAFFYRFWLMIIGARPQPNGKAALDIAAGDLPVITILAPLYKDAEALASLSCAIDALDYPAAKKDVKLLLEHDDRETLAEAKRLGLGARYDIVSVPDIGPKTKPKACNVGLHLSQGDLIVIYDAEDQPETDQLLKAAQAFASGDRQLACLQARLNYYNARENWLTRLFTLEYSLWFDWLLPALQRLGAPIPLGGTSNFFRRDILLKVGGWDPYNVTEDADLGLRLSKLGYRVEMLDSTTYEEANCRFQNWVRQRSRWIKGHLQTWLVHMRQPGKIVATTGWGGLLLVQLFLAGNVFSALINPVLWATFLMLHLPQLRPLRDALPDALNAANLFALIAGNLCFIVCAVVAPLKRGWRGLCAFGLTAPLYWLFTSLAAYKALWQIVFRPYYWEKTNHVISKLAIERRNAALSRVAADI